jgi:hypothetical protein
MEPEVHYRVHKSPPLAPVLSQIDSVHTIPFYLSKIYFIIQGVLPTVLWLRNWSETKRFMDALCTKVGATGERERERVGLCRVWGSHSGGYEQFYFLGYTAV